MSAFSVENPQDGKTFEKYSRFEWGVEVDVVTTFMLRLFVPHEFDMVMGISVAPEMGIVMEGSLKDKNYIFDLPLLNSAMSRVS